ncbi:hypothetical protein [Streptomyces sp. JJ36]|uniref:hypothetical protein n=1 Tax=Streptomyces sp. JJ36 TaxID=2736645 RepID=UPI001F181C9F|nr:hypothetical protein [Streptomyces sp. JJ36]MCF6522056.1 hypothetical protein [Streptomyces sp. JJ36]
MELLLLLIALTVLVAVFAAPLRRRMRLQRQGAGGGPLAAVSPESAYAFVPVDELDVRLPGPDPQLVDALEEAQAEQDPTPVARLLALTGDEWELRWQRVQSLAGAAARELAEARAAQAAEQAAGQSRGKGADGAAEGHDGAGGPGAISFTKRPGGPVRDASWLRRWRAGQPGDQGGAQVYAQFLVWQALAEGDPDSRRIILEEARTICREAARIADADPTPYLTELHVARGLGDRRADFEALWTEVVRRAPHHMGAHLAALQYWSARGQGSKALADGFAQTAAAHAPEGTLLPALPLFAAFEHLPEVNLVRGLYQSEEIRRAIEAAEFAVDQVEGDHPVRPHVLHLLVCMLVRAERYGEAMEALRVVDGYVGALPWAAGDDPAAQYAAYRALAVAGYEASGGTRAELPPPQAG